MTPQQIRITLVTGALALLPVLAQAGPSDAWLTSKAKMALLTADGIDSMNVNVDTVRGRITLHGKVETEAERKHAEEVARKIDGVTGVQNLLQVVPDASKKMVKATDEEIKKNIQQSLKADESLADSSIHVESVNHGVVLLGGKAESLSDQLAALRHARRVGGVVQVASEIKSPATLSDEEVWHTTTTTTTTGSKTRDMWITSAVKMSLLANGDTPALDINVDTVGGEVTLFGIVPTMSAKTAAETTAMKVDGVKKVNNGLQVVAKEEQAAVKENDAEITARVEQELKRDEALNGSDISVEVKDRVVRLTGKVRSNSDRLQAAIDARSVSGVRAVQEDLQISTAQAAK